MSTDNADRPLRLLSLDGGGVRGLSSIIILKHLMEEISKRRGRVVQPWEEFDMIGGTSTGGLIAIMLGRLRMTIEQCEDAYLRLSERIFTPKRSRMNPLRSKDFLRADGKFDHKMLEEAIKEIIVKVAGMEEGALLKDPDLSCKVFVCAAQTKDAGVALFRSYDTPDVKFLFEECKIWEVCRATSAATTFFDPIKIGKFRQEFVDGGILYNNPIQLVAQEATTLWANRMNDSIIVSIGTGSAPGAVFRGNIKKIVDGMKAIVTQTEQTANDFMLANKPMDKENRLFRFTVLHGLAEVGLQEWKQRGDIASATQSYLRRGEVSKHMEYCIEQLSKPTPADAGPSSVDIPLREQNALNSEPGNYRNRYSEQDLSDCLHSLSFEGMDSRKYNVNPAHQGTCDWLFETPSFTKWKDQTDLQTNNGILWIQGHPGVGKSTLVKHALLHCQEEFKDSNIAFFFFNARGRPLERNPEGMLRSLMIQLLELSPSLKESFVPIFKKKKRRHGNTRWEWEKAELKDFLLRQYTVQRHCKNTLLFIDALDECDDPDVQMVVDFLAELSENAIRSESTLRICLSSRHYPYIDIPKKVKMVVEQQADHDQDISKYVEDKLRTKNKDIQKRILEKAKHIFMWVVLVVQLLNDEFAKGKIKAMWKKLEAIPSDLDELFSKLLKEGTSEEDRKTTILLFQWVLFLNRDTPLEPSELYFAVMTGTDPDDLGAWDQSQVEPEAIERFITITSRGLVGIAKSENKRRDDAQYVVQFIHQSVIDYLTRNQRLAKLDPTLAPNPGASHARLASCCLAYVMQEELRLRAIDILSLTEPLDSDDEDDDEGHARGLKASYPFLQYATDNLLKHAEKAQADGISQIMFLRQLKTRKNYDIFVSLHDALEDHESRKYEGGSLLYVVSHEDSYHLIQILLSEFKMDVNAQGGHYGNALQVASYSGLKDIVALLLEHGADVNAQGGQFGNALQAASLRALKDIVALLLEHGADVNAQGGHYGNALQAASYSGLKDIVALLLEHGADVNAQGRLFGNALQAASYGGLKDIVALLLEHGADVNAQGGYYGNALQAASLRAQKDMVALLLEHGADVNAQGGHYGNALQAASLRAQKDMVALLLEHGADVNAQGGYYGNALQAASYGSRKDMVALLLEHGAHVNAQGGYYGNALQAVSRSSRKDIVVLLLEHGADVNALGDFTPTHSKLPSGGGYYHQSREGDGEEAHAVCTFRDKSPTTEQRSISIGSSYQRHKPTDRSECTAATFRNLSRPE